MNAGLPTRTGAPRRAESPETIFRKMSPGNQPFDSWSAMVAGSRPKPPSMVSGHTASATGRPFAAQSAAPRVVSSTNEGTSRIWSRAVQATLLLVARLVWTRRMPGPGAVGACASRHAP